MDWFNRLFSMLMLAEDDPGGGGDPPPAEPEEITLPDDVPKYMAQSSREQKTNKELLQWSKQYEKLPDVLTAAYEAQTKLKNIVPVPGEKATDEELSAYMRAIGVPEKPEGYEFEAELADEDKTELQKLAHANGLTPSQAKAVATAYTNVKEGAKINAEEALAKKNMEVASHFKKEWGEADYGPNMELVGRAARSYFAVDEKSVLNGELGSDPKIIEGLYRIGKDMVDTPLGPSRSGKLDPKKETPKTFEYPSEK